jgi:centromeric protein E
MRPLNNTEENRKRIWKVLPKYSSIAQTTRDGKPLPERITGRTFFTFDKTFGESTNNTQVYDSVAKGIVNSVVDGLNGTIFAYGQTSSGKTYTMQGAGNLEQGMGGEGGVVHMAANDIFSQITRKQERNFLVRVSFLEIYNEEVRDLLGDTSQTLQIREDPRRGVFVQSEEEVVTDFNGLLEVLIQGDKSRTFASTGMNERSSRSHTILRITIESREKEYDEDSSREKGYDEDELDAEDDYDMDSENRNPKSDGAIRISTLNLVDLAGSESVRHTGATGDRQKEGGLINQRYVALRNLVSKKKRCVRSNKVLCCFVQSFDFISCHRSAWISESDAY